MKKKILMPVIVLIVVAAASGGVFYFYHAGKKPPPAPVLQGPPATQAQIQSQLQRRGEALYRQRYYAPLIATYMGMLQKMPDNIEIKKKLARAYIGAGNMGEAKKILAGIDDAEAKEMLEKLK